MDILTVARDEYRQQLAEIMTPHMVVVFQEMYDKAVQLSKGKRVLQKFQELLRDVKEWNSNIVKGHSDTINNACSWYNDLLAAVFVSSVKILASVRLSAEKKKINVKIPPNDTFIQGCYENAARDLFKDPYIFQEEGNEYDRDIKLMARFNDAILLTVKNMVPVQEILKTNIGTRDDSETVGFEAGGGLSDEEEEEPEPAVGEGEGLSEEPAAGEGETDPAAGEAPAEGPTPAPAVGGAPEVRDIPLEGQRLGGEGEGEYEDDDDDDEDLAPGAPPK
jgi:hypothetical protein